MEIFNPTKGTGERAIARDEQDPPGSKGDVVIGRILGKGDDGLTRVRIGPRLLNAILSQYVEAGDDVKLKILQTAPQLILEPLTGETDAPAQPAGETVPAGTNPLAKGQLVLAKILEDPRGSKVRLQLIIPAGPDQPFPEKNGAVHSPFPRSMPVKTREVLARLEGHETGLLREGQVVRFRIEESLPRLVLRPESPAPPSTQRTPLAQLLAVFLADPGKLDHSAAALRNLMPELQQLPPEVRSRLQELARLIEGLSPKPAGPDKEFLGRLLEHSGFVNHRTRLQESIGKVWSELLQSPDLEQLKEDKPARALLDTAVRLNQAMDRLHLVNQETSRSSQQIHLTFPVFWPGTGGRGEILMNLPSAGKDKKEKPPMKVSLLLNLSSIGRLKVDLEISRNRLGGAIWVESPRTKEKIDHTLNRLKTSLDARGFKVDYLHVKRFPAEQRPPDTLAEELLPKGAGLIDVKV